MNGTSSHRATHDAPDEDGDWGAANERKGHIPHGGHSLAARFGFVVRSSPVGSRAAHESNCSRAITAARLGDSLRRGACTSRITAGAAPRRARTDNICKIWYLGRRYRDRVRFRVARRSAGDVRGHVSAPRPTGATTEQKSSPLMSTPPGRYKKGIKTLFLERTHVDAGWSWLLVLILQYRHDASKK